MNVVCILRSEILSMLHSSPCDPSLFENTGVSLFKNWMLVFFLLLNERERELRLWVRYIEENYSKIRDVEREFGNLTLEMKLTAGPKKVGITTNSLSLSLLYCLLPIWLTCLILLSSALEHLRKKIEACTEKIHAAKLKEDEARKVLFLFVYVSQCFLLSLGIV